MSINPETDLDLEKLFLPAWAQEPASANRYAKFTGEEKPSERRRGDRPGHRPPRRDGGNREAGRRDERPRPQDRDGGFSRGPRGEQSAPHRSERQERREPPVPLPEVAITLQPDEKGVESLARQIKVTGRAYPLFDIARIILQKPERSAVEFSVIKNPSGQPAQPLFLCALDDTLWLSEDEATSHVLRSHFAMFYQAERTATEPPKGKYTFVAQCGLSGVVLGPPNYHDYQNQLRKLHAERFSRMPFEVYKSRVRIVRDEEVVKKWVDEQSWKTEFVCLNVPEPQRLATRAEVEQHFRATHKDTIIKAVEAHRLSGAAARAMRCQALARLVRQVTEDQRRFPLQLATLLSQQFASHGLQFFKVNKTVTHVSVARPRYLDLETTPVSEGIRRIVEYINAHPKCSRRQLIETLAPSPTVIPVAPAPAAPPVAEGTAPTQTPPPGETALAQPEPTPEQTAVIADLHWLVHQGHVIEFANGMLDTAKKPLTRPPKPEAKPTAVPADVTVAAVAESIAGDSSVVSDPIAAVPDTTSEPAAIVTDTITAPAPTVPEEVPATVADPQV